MDNEDSPRSLGSFSLVGAWEQSSNSSVDSQEQVDFFQEEQVESEQEIVFEIDTSEQENAQATQATATNQQAAQANAAPAQVQQPSAPMNNQGAPQGQQPNNPVNPGANQQPGPGAQPPTFQQVAPRPVFRPDEPTMGGLIQVRGDEFAAWTGGKPLADWTGLDGVLHHKSPQQMRFTRDDTAYDNRCSGLKEQFDRESNLSRFQRRILEALTARGLDTISYLQDPSNAAIMVNVVTDHTRFTYDYVRDAAT